MTSPVLTAIPPNGTQETDTTWILTELDSPTLDVANLNDVAEDSPPPPPSLSATQRTMTPNGSARTRGNLSRQNAMYNPSSPELRARLNGQDAATHENNLQRNKSLVGR